MPVIPAQSARLPHEALQLSELPGWDPRLSRLVTIHADQPRQLHVLDTGKALDDLGLVPDATLIAVHGNPTWSYLWRHLAVQTLQNAEQRLSSKTRSGSRSQQPVLRVIAPDQVDMGFSERLEHPAPPQHRGSATSYRTLEQRLDDLDALVEALVADPEQPIFTIGHDWGGVISLGWATRAAERGDARIHGLLTLNTAVHQPADAPVPAPLRAALAGPLLAGSTITTSAFNRVSHSLAERGVDPTVRRAYQAPYATKKRRGGVGGFVADIPTDAQHRSHRTLQEIATRLSRTQLPALVLWGAEDPVFLDRYQEDLLKRISHADIHRYEKAGHLLVEDVDIVEPVLTWISQKLSGDTPAGKITSKPYQPLWHFLDEWADSGEKALVDMTILEDDEPFSTSWSQLASIVDSMAVGLRKAGMKPGDRVSMLVTPGRDLTAALYAVLRVGGVAVVADQGLGIQGMTRAIRTAHPSWIIGLAPGLTLARVQNFPGRRISVKPMSGISTTALGVEHSLYGFAAAHAGEVYEPTAHHPDPQPEDLAAILFTSGSTGAAKGVRYTHERLSNLTQLLRDAFGVAPGSSLLAGFAPFALLGPAIGATSVTPKMSVTKPATLTARALADAALAGDATMAFASPAALNNVAKTAHELNPQQREALARITMMLSAGAPVTAELSERIQQLLPAAEFHTPYGMTESLLLTDIEHRGTTITEPEAGVCVGNAVPGVRLAMAPLNSLGESSETLLEGSEATGKLAEIVISAPHMRQGYDKLWHTNLLASRDTVDGLAWHRTGDIGHLDSQGRLWIEGRTHHVISTPSGPLGPGGPEDLIVALPEVNRAAVVGHGPRGTQAIVAIVELTEEHSNTPAGLAPTELSTKVRNAAGVPVAAVLVTQKVPVDIRHNSKIDRTRLAHWADQILTGSRVGNP